jgi:NTE family protein
MTRALVLGGGGPVGIGWESGLAVGLAGEGVVLDAADFIVGTSAGSVVGAQLALRMDLAAAVAAVSAPLPVTSGADAAVAGLMEAMAKAAAGTVSPEAARIELGRIAVEADTVDEERFVARFDQVADQPWPAAYRCTAIDVVTGALAVWDRDSGVALPRAVASSCAVPGVFPPITIGGRRYMDGGMRTALNADLAAGHDAVIVVSCFALALPDGMSDPIFDAMLAQVDAELEILRRGGTVEVIAPGEEFLAVSGWGLNLMDPGRAAAAYDAGVRQAAVEAERLRAAWHD